MKYIRLISTLFLFILITPACNLNYGGFQRVEGSGVLNGQERSLAEFTGIEVASSADVFVTFGDTQRVVVETDNNILPLVETSVNAGRLIIKTKSNTEIVPKHPIRVSVLVRSLDAASISGSGNINIDGVNAQSFRLDLPGSGNISVVGTAAQVAISLQGSGNILCGDLQAQSATVDLDGSGDIIVFASQRLDATIRGSGNIHYRGNPGEVNQSVTGSGILIPVP